jgi:hypothetical protein
VSAGSVSSEINADGPGKRGQGKALGHDKDKKNKK